VHEAFGELVHAMLAEYVPFIILLTALYTVAGGIRVRGNLHGTPRVNTAILALGTLLASVMGTTGAAMLLIRPLLRANDNRRHTVHVVVFFIFLVANVGGSLSPLGDPPLFLGFLEGVSFFWTTTHLALPMLFVSAALLACFYALDSYYFHQREEERSRFLDPTPEGAPGGIDGKINLLLLAAVIALVLMSGLWRPAVTFDVFGTPVALQNALRDIALIAVTLLSLALTPRAARAGNDFNWAPIEEVAKLFAGIFVTIAPVIIMLRAGEAGAFAGVVHLVNDPAGQPRDIMYFWATGLLSSFLDNAPTYLVFFNLAGGDAQKLMTTGATTLAAISAGAVFMGANTYIGNAPNFMVKAIAQSRGVRMPSFFAFMGWSGAVLLPLFALTGWLFF
jgi:Na+/H+ antiporter NhaD/arsenite permease-like protein